MRQSTAVIALAIVALIVVSAATISYIRANDPDVQKQLEEEKEHPDDDVWWEGWIGIFSVIAPDKVMSYAEVVLESINPYDSLRLL